jgi:hypothetical protein
MPGIGNWTGGQGSPPDSEAIERGAERIRNVKIDVDASFPLFSGGAVSASESQVEFAALNFDSAAKTKYDNYEASITANTDAAQNNTDKLVDVLSAVNFGVITGGTNSFKTSPNTGTWSVANSSTGVYDVTHDLGVELHPVVSIVTTQTGQRVVAQVDSVAVNTFTIRVRNNTSNVDPSLITFIAL